MEINCSKRANLDQITQALIDLNKPMLAKKIV